MTGPFRPLSSPEQQFLEDPDHEGEHRQGEGDQITRSIILSPRS